MSIGYVYIIIDEELPNKIYLGYTDYLPRKVIEDYKIETGRNNAQMEWFLSLPDSKLAWKMIQFKLSRFKSYLSPHTYNLNLDTALGYFLKDIADFFEIFKNRDKINWRMNQFVTYEELCAKTQLELLYPLLHRTYIRNQLAIIRREQGLKP